MDNAFDLSDVSPPAIDRLDDVLTIAAEVLGEYGENPVRTRILRLAEWLVLNVGGSPHQTEVTREGYVKYTGDQEHPHLALLRVGGLYVTEDKDGKHHAVAVGQNGALAFAVAMLRAVESAES